LAPTRLVPVECGRLARRYCRDWPWSRSSSLRRNGKGAVEGASRACTMPRQWRPHRTVATPKDRMVPPCCRRRPPHPPIDLGALQMRPTGVLLVTLRKMTTKERVGNNKGRRRCHCSGLLPRRHKLSTAQGLSRTLQTSPYRRTWRAGPDLGPFPLHRSGTTTLASRECRQVPELARRVESIAAARAVTMSPPWIQFRTLSPL
jgi:hypothetical protein